jgi:hypothetical protein
VSEKAADRPFSCAVSAASAPLPIIPQHPHGDLRHAYGTSVGYLFLGGICRGGPGRLPDGVDGIISTKRKYPVGRWYPIREFVKIFLDSFLALLAPVILLGGIYTGVFTPTEAAGIVCVYALLLSLLVYRTLGLKQLYKILLESVVAAGFTSFTIGGAFLFGYVLAREQIPAKVAEAFIAMGITSAGPDHAVDQRPVPDPGLLRGRFRLAADRGAHRHAPDQGGRHRLRAFRGGGHPEPDDRPVHPALREAAFIISR